MLKKIFKGLLRREYQTLNLIEVSEKALINNFRYFQKNNPHKRLAPVLKSNAYGHGIKTVADLVDKKLNPAFITVDSLYEAYELKKAKIKTKPLLIGYTNPRNFKIGPKIDYCLPVYDLETAQVIARFQPRAEVHIKIDSGMGRLGVQPNQARDFARKLKKIKNLKISGIYSHLSQSSELNKSFSQNQIKTFKQVIKTFEQEGIKFRWKHIEATSGSIITNDPEFNLIRPGLGLYGLTPFPPNSKEHKNLTAKLNPALKLITHLAQTKTVPPNSFVGYGGTYKTKSKTKLGILPLGYYEGLDRRLSNRGVVKVKNIFCPIVGRVCMNLTIIDLSNVPDAQIGDQVTVFSNQSTDPNTISKSSEIAETIPYVLLVNLAESIRRQLV